MKRRLVLMLLVVLAGLAQPAVLAADQPQPTVPRFELGGAGGVFAAISNEGPFAIAVWGPRLSINVTDRTGFDLVGDIIAPTESSGLYGIYGIQIRRVIRGGGPTRSAIFITGGVIGSFEYEHTPERRVQRPDGSVVVYRANTKTEATPPVGISGGIGMQRVLARHAAFRADAQAMFGFDSVFLLRGALGISIPIGGSYAPRQ